MYPSRTRDGLSVNHAGYQLVVTKLDRLGRSPRSTWTSSTR
ncbi:hypothetical protein [Parafrankia sp. EUN1f]|nr:hypothetical protein [Parafrankia sp. EUN1f]